MQVARIGKFPQHADPAFLPLIVTIARDLIVIIAKDPPQ